MLRRLPLILRKIPNYEPPFATFDIWVEWWLPVGYFGGRKSSIFRLLSFMSGIAQCKSTLNVIDMPRAPGEPSTPNRFAAPLPRSLTLTVPR